MKKHTAYPVIDMQKTGANIKKLREERGLTVDDLRAFFGFEYSNAIYSWQQGQSLPSVDHLYALSAILEVPMNDILVPVKPMKENAVPEPVAPAATARRKFFIGCLSQFIAA